MYIQITDKCNMTCEHCCFACTKKGTFMSMATFKAALECATNRDDTIAIGGGEPTLHPHFEKFLLLAIAACGKSGNGNKVFIVNNGSMKERALMLGQLSAAGIIEAQLSYDQFHNMEMVSPEVVEYYRSMGALWGPAMSYFNRDQTDIEPARSIVGLVKAGRAVQFEDAGQTGSQCACSDIFVKPNGDVYQCGCVDSPKLGDVFSDYDSLCSGECHNSVYYKREVEAMAE